MMTLLAIALYLLGCVMAHQSITDRGNRWGRAAAVACWPLVAVAALLALLATMTLHWLGEDLY